MMKDLVGKHYKLKPKHLVAVGVTQNGERTYFGMSSDGELRDVGHLVFEVGSVTKVFTTILFMHFVRLGKVGLHDKLNTYIPKMIDSDITLYQLATHTSGLPRDANNMKLKWKNRHNPFKEFQLEDAYSFMENYKSKKKGIAHKPRYSNIGMAMLGNVLASVEELSYEDSLKKYIFEPLQMNDTFITFDQNKTIQEVKAPINLKDYYPRLELYGDAPAGAIKSTIQDMLRFLEANMGLFEHPLYEDMMLSHQNQNLAPLNKDVMMGIGWMISLYGTKKKEIITHGGTTLGFKTHIGFSKEHKIGVVVFDNIHIGFLSLIRMLIKREYTKVESLAEMVYDKHL
ncbi:beta-lactamase family protein [Cytobacillus suaedae]|nr:beta-lactamase family protein [Cytobacillus suaedae]